MDTKWHWDHCEDVADFSQTVLYYETYEGSIF